MKKSKKPLKAMHYKIQSGNAIDLSDCEITESGDYILEKLEPGYMGFRMNVKENGEHFEYCDFRLEKWIQVIGICAITGLVLASLRRDFLSNPSRYQIIYKR